MDKAESVRANGKTHRGRDGEPASQTANQQKALIVGLPPILSCSANHRCKHVAERLLTVGGNDIFEPLEAELGVARVEHLGETIGDERKEVASLKVHGCHSIPLLLEHAEWQGGTREGAAHGPG